jgi:hypothetical protein
MDLVVESHSRGFRNVKTAQIKENFVVKIRLSSVTDSREIINLNDMDLVFTPGYQFSALNFSDSKKTLCLGRRKMPYAKKILDCFRDLAGKAACAPRQNASFSSLFFQFKQNQSASANSSA